MASRAFGALGMRSPGPADRPGVLFTLGTLRKVRVKVLRAPSNFASVQIARDPSHAYATTSASSLVPAPHSEILDGWISLALRA